jgi:NADPH-dependent curcumin reductase CurA
VPISTESPTNHQVRLAARPSGRAKATDWEFTSEPVPAPGPGQFVVAISHLSIDPAMRGWMNAGASYVPPVEVGAVMRAGAVGRVTASEHPGFPEALLMLFDGANTGKLVLALDAST